MKADADEQLFNNEYCARTRALRDARGWTAEQMATALGVPPDRYRKYDYRSPLPAYLVERFCLITGTEIDYFITGKSNRPVSFVREVIETKPKHKKLG